MGCHSLLSKSGWWAGRGAAAAHPSAPQEKSHAWTQALRAGRGPAAWRARRWPVNGCKSCWRPSAGTRRVQEACARLHISEQRFDQLRTQVLQAGLDSLEPRRAGRRPQVVPAAEVQALQARVSELEIELRAARVREEIALALPAVGVTATEPAKKSPRRRSSAQAAAGRRDQPPPSPNGVEPRGPADRVVRRGRCGTPGAVAGIVLDSPSGRRHLAAAGQLLATATSLPGRAGPPARGRLPPVGRGARADSDRESRRLAGHLGTDLRDWEQRLRSGATMVPVLGRPVLRSELAARQAVLSYWSASAPGWGWRCWRASSPRCRERS